MFIQKKKVKQKEIIIEVFCSLTSEKSILHNVNVIIVRNKQKFRGENTNTSKV